MRLREKVLERLQGNPGKKHTAREIAEWIYKKYPKECEEKRQRAKNEMGQKELIQALIAEIGSNWNNKGWRTKAEKLGVKRDEGSSPKRYYYEATSSKSGAGFASLGRSEPGASPAEKKPKTLQQAEPKPPNEKENLASTLWDKALRLLKNSPGKQYTAKEIAEWVYANYTGECREKIRKSGTMNGKADLIDSLATKIRSQWRALDEKLGSKLEVKRTGGTPQRYYYELASQEGGEEDASSGSAEHPSPAKVKGLAEKDLYPMLAQYGRSLGVYCKFIREGRTSHSGKKKGTHQQKGTNQWLHPDLVGMQDLTHNWKIEIRSATTPNEKARFWSFEVKLKVKTADLREIFFQTVSNSSWAHFGYLVVGERPAEKLMAELRILSGLHGMGLIQIDVDDPVKSQILLPARERTDVDWNTANRLMANRDFKDFIEQVNVFNKTGTIIPSAWPLTLPRHS